MCMVPLLCPLTTCVEIGFLTACSPRRLLNTHERRESMEEDSKSSHRLYRPSETVPLGPVVETALVRLPQSSEVIGGQHRASSTERGLGVFEVPAHEQDHHFLVRGDLFRVTLALFGCVIRFAHVPMRFLLGIMQVIGDLAGNLLPSLPVHFLCKFERGTYALRDGGRQQWSRARFPPGRSHMHLPFLS